MDTITAIATPPGFGGVGIVRVSGPLVTSIAQAILGRCPAPRHADYLPFLAADGETLDEGIALFFRGPHSFTGDDVLELQGHGGPLVLERLLQRVLSLGARVAKPGEFSQRAYLNDKLDLAQAEAIADLINATTARAAQSALASLRGVFSERVHALVTEVIEFRVYIESYIDFVDEEIPFLSDAQIDQRLAVIREKVDEILARANVGRVLNEGMSVVIIGPPNAGKSSLLNQLAHEDIAIVTPIAGTTRDVLKQTINIDGLPLHVLDTAGLRDSDDLVEQEGVKRALAVAQRADHLLIVSEDDGGTPERVAKLRAALPSTTPFTVVINKIDLSGRSAGPVPEDSNPTIAVSAASGAGMDALRARLKQAMGYDSNATEGLFTARARHIAALKAASEHLQTASTVWPKTHAIELLAEELRLVQRALNEITGEFDNEALLDRIFSSFCIGK